VLARDRPCFDDGEAIQQPDAGQQVTHLLGRVKERERAGAVATRLVAAQDREEPAAVHEADAAEIEDQLLRLSREVLEGSVHSLSGEAVELTV
jgi:hypothetical protein